MTDSQDPTFNHHRIGGEPLSSPLDDDRLASMADEGGVSGALMEIDDAAERSRLMATQRRKMGFGRWGRAGAAFALVGLAVIAWGWIKRNA